MTLTLPRIVWRTSLGAVLLATILAVAGAALLHRAAPALSGAATSPPAATVSLEGIAAKDPSRPVEVVVQFAGRSAFEHGRATLATAGATITRDLHIINAYGARLSAADAENLTRNPAVHAVSLNAAVKTSGAMDSIRTTFLQSVRIDRLWSASTGTSTWSGTGRGVTVAVVDTGIAGNHPDFRVSSANANNRIAASVVTNPDATTENDTYGHGTHVAGLIAGNGFARPTNDPLRGAYVGTAPHARLVSVKVSDDDGNTSLIDVIYGLQFVVDHKDDYGIRVVNLSLNSATAESYTTDPLDAAVESAWMHGIVVVAAAGNRGTSDDAVSYAPANDPYVISVGGVDTMGTPTPADDALASWSSRGVTQDGFAKPEIVAPGAHITAPYAPDSAFGSLCPSCITDGEYFTIGGTSMAAAIVSGIAADLIGLHPDWSPDRVKTALINNRRLIGTGSRTGQEVDAQRAYDTDTPRVTANVGLTPNTLIDPATGDIDYTRASWSRASWSEVTGERASWSRASWSRASWSRASWSCDCALAVTGEADPTRASWSRASWSRASWSRASWSADFSK